MKRILLIICKNFLRLPYVWFGLCYYAWRTDRYSEARKYTFLKKIAKWIVSAGKVNIKVYGQDKLPDENGFVFFPNHHGVF